MPRPRKKKIGGKSIPVHFTVDSDTSENSDNVFSLSQLPSLAKHPRTSLNDSSVPVPVPGPCNNPIDVGDSSEHDVAEMEYESQESNESFEQPISQEIHTPTRPEPACNVTLQNVLKPVPSGNVALQSDLEPDDDSDSDDDDNSFDPMVKDFKTIFSKLKKDWLSIELDHKVSHTCSEEFWKLALKLMPPLIQSKKEQQIRRKVPQFAQIRKQMYDDLSPEVTMEVGYVEKQTGEMHIVKDDKTQTNNFPPSQFIKQYEISSVKVKKTHSYVYGLL